jgi:hypothetical protein
MGKGATTLLVTLDVAIVPEELLLLLGAALFVGALAACSLASRACRLASLCSSSAAALAGLLAIALA